MQKRQSNRADAPAIFLLALTALLMCPQSSPGADTGASPAKPNIVLVMTDDQGWYELGSHDNPHIQTPVLDRLATESMELTRFYASPVCTPTRASLMTGRYYQRTGAIDTYMGRDTMDAREITIAQLLKEAGYRTGIFGKWHLGRYGKYHPLSRGFDEFVGFWQYGYINRYDDSDELFHNREPIVTSGYVTDVLTDQAIEFVQENRERPFFLYLPYNAPHSPYQVPDSYIKPYLARGLDLNTARIYGMITCIDRNMARLLKAIDDAQLRDNTVVIFMTDNGGVSTFHKSGLRGNKASCYEGGIRVPFLARWPQHFPAGAKIDARAAHIDVLPTLCEIAGVQPPGNRVIDGKSLVPLLTGKTTGSPHEYLFHQWNRVRPNPSQSWAVHHGQWKLVNGELFDIVADPGETNNMVGAQPELARQMREAFLKWFAEVTRDQKYERVPIGVGRPDENPVEVDVAWSDVEQPLKFNYGHYNRAFIEGFATPPAGSPPPAAKWKIDVVTPGRYEVTLSYGRSDAPGETALRLKAGSADVRLPLQPTGGVHLWATQCLGTITLSSGEQTLELATDTIAAPESVMVHEIWLKRVGS